MNNNTATHEQIQKLANSVKMAALLSLAVNAHQLYSYLKEPTEFKDLLSIIIGILGTLLIWLFGRELRSMKKVALLYWIALIVIGFARFSMSGDSFTLTLPSIASIVLWSAMTGRLVVWTRNKALA